MNVKVGIEAEMMERTKAFRGSLGPVCERPRNGAAFHLERAVANLHNIQPRLRRKSSSFFFLSAAVLMVAANYIQHHFLPSQGVCIPCRANLQDAQHPDDWEIFCLPIKERLRKQLSCHAMQFIKRSQSGKKLLEEFQSKKQLEEFQSKKLLEEFQSDFLSDVPSSS